MGQDCSDIWPRFCLDYWDKEQIDDTMGQDCPDIWPRFCLDCWDKERMDETMGQDCSDHRARNSSEGKASTAGCLLRYQQVKKGNT